MITNEFSFCRMSSGQAGDAGILQRFKRHRAVIVMGSMVVAAHFGWRWLQNQPGVRHPDAPINQDVREEWPIVRVRLRAFEHTVRTVKFLSKNSILTKP